MKPYLLWPACAMAFGAPTFGLLCCLKISGFDPASGRRREGISFVSLSGACPPYRAGTSACFLPSTMCLLVPGLLLLITPTTYQGFLDSMKVALLSERSSSVLCAVHLAHFECTFFNSRQSLNTLGCVLGAVSGKQT